MLQAVTLTLVKRKTGEKNRKYEKEKKISGLHLYNNYSFGDCLIVASLLHLFLISLIPKYLKLIKKCPFATEQTRSIIQKF